MAVKNKIISGIMLSTTALSMAACSTQTRQQVSGTIAPKKSTSQKNDTKVKNSDGSALKALQKQVALLKAQTAQADEVTETPETVTPVASTSEDTLAAAIDQVTAVSADNAVSEISQPVIAEQPSVTITQELVETAATSEQPVSVSVAPTTTVKTTQEQPTIAVTPQTSELPVSEPVVETPVSTEGSADSSIETTNQTAAQAEIDSVATSEITQPEIATETSIEQPVVEEQVQPEAVVVAQPEQPQVQPTVASAQPQYDANNVNTYPQGQCTWGVKAVAPWVGNNWGNGADWANSARAAGYVTGSTPVAGSVASWDDGGYGHVAYVTDTDSSSGMIQVLEANYAGNQSINNYRGWFDPTNCQGTVTYIYNQQVG